MKKGFTIVLMCCALVLALGLAACGGSSGGSGASGGASGGATSEPQPVQKTDAELMLGTWEDQYGQTMAFSADKMVLDAGGATVDCTYEIDESKHTVTIVAKGTTIPMEYRFVDENTMEVTSDGTTETMVRIKDAAGNPIGEDANVDLTNIPAECLDIDGGVTVNAVMDLTGPELTALLKQQGYEWGTLGWENPTNGDRLMICTVDDDTVRERGYETAKEKGELGKGYIRIVTDARKLETTADLETVRDAIAQGFTVEDSWVAGGGAYYYNVVSDAAGGRYILTVVANDVNEAIVELSSDAYLTAKGDGGVNGVIEVWKS